MHADEGEEEDDGDDDDIATEDACHPATVVVYRCAAVVTSVAAAAVDTVEVAEAAAPEEYGCCCAVAGACGAAGRTGDGAGDDEAEAALDVLVRRYPLSTSGAAAEDAIAADTPASSPGRERGLYRYTAAQGTQ